MSDKPQFTPGPWLAEMERRPNGGPIEFFLGPERAEKPGEIWETIIEGTLWKTYGGDEAADAHLIAAAPDMYAALEALVPLLAKDVRGSGPEMMKYAIALEAMYAALAKARGETND